jgi:hypothetical protein
MVAKAIEEQARCRDWLAENGHNVGVNGIDSRLARMGAGDWLAEEILSLNPYHEFLENRLQDSSREGFKPLWMPSFLFDFQAAVAEWELWKGKSAAFLDCGMGKSVIELVWAENVVRKTNRPTLILTPIAVGKQFIRESEKFGMEAHRSDGSKIYPGINITNYEKLHRFNPHDFAGVICDESSAIKAFNGKRRADVTEFLRTIPYRLMATATAAPNDYIELGTTSEALGVMGQVDMLGRFFKNDQNNCDGKRLLRRSPAQGGPVSAGWRFKGHAEIPFWRWVSGWSRAGRRPSDLGPFSDERFVLPPLIEREHVVETRTLAAGKLFATAAANRPEELEERRRTIPERCEKAAELVNTGKPFVIWCQLNPEGELLERFIKDAVHISGAQSDDEKEEKYEAFLTGQSRGMISKQRIGGWGLNLQHCAHVVEFADHSFEAHYQGVRRCYRFGQTEPVINDIISTEGQRGAKENMQRKSAAADRMFTSLVEHMNNAIRIDAGYKFEKDIEVPSWL